MPTVLAAALRTEHSEDLPQIIERATRTVLKSGHDCKPRGIDDVTVVIEADRIDIDAPRQLGRLDTQIFQVNNAGPFARRGY